MTRAEKSQLLIDECIAKMNADDRKVYRPIAEYALALGFTPRLVKASVKTSGGTSDELAFCKSKIGRTLLRINPMFLKAPVNYQIHEAGKAKMRLVFFATHTYSEPFLLGVKHVIEAFEGKYTGCYGCGRCSGELQGYTYTYPDGRAVFRCGGQLIELPATIGMAHVDEVKAMMKAQDDFWMNALL